MLYSLLLLAHAEQSIVFVGNSYTQYNALPSQVDSTLEATMSGWSAVEVTSLTGGGLNLANHATRMNDQGSMARDFCAHTIGLSFRIKVKYQVFQSQRPIGRTLLPDCNKCMHRLPSWVEKVC